MRLQIIYFDKKENSPGSLLTKLSFDAANINGIVINSFGVLVQSFSTLLVGILLGFLFDWRINLINLAFAPLIFLANAFAFKNSELENEKTESIENQSGEILSECICNTKMVFAYNFQNKAVETVRIHRLHCCLYLKIFSV